MKEIVFTSENLERHRALAEESLLINGRRLVYTTCKHVKGVEGEIFKIDGIGSGYFILNNVFEYIGRDSIRVLIKHHYRDEGFNSPAEFSKELRNLYGKLPTTLYLHHFLEVFGIEEDVV